MNEKVSFKFRLGDRVKDRVTNYVGIVDMRKQCLNGCIQYSVQGPVIEDGKLDAGWYIDEGQLIKIDNGVNAKPIKKSKTGGPMTKVKR